MIRKPIAAAGHERILIEKGEKSAFQKTKFIREVGAWPDKRWFVFQIQREIMGFRKAFQYGIYEIHIDRG